MVKAPSQSDILLNGNQTEIQMRLHHKNNIGFAYKDVAQKNPEFPAIIAETSVLSYAQLWELVDSLREKCRSMGLGTDHLLLLILVI